MQNITKWFNVLIQSWNTIFFAFLAFGGFYLMTQGSLLVGVLLMLIGLGGAWFCLQQAQKWNDGRIVKLSATPLRNRPHMVFCSQGTS